MVEYPVEVQSGKAESFGVGLGLPPKKLNLWSPGERRCIPGGLMRLALAATCVLGCLISQAELCWGYRADFQQWYLDLSSVSIPSSLFTQKMQVLKSKVLTSC